MKQIKNFIPAVMKHPDLLPMQQQTYSSGLPEVRESSKRMLEKFKTAEKLIIGLNHEMLEKKYSGIRTAGDAYDTGYITLNEIDKLYGENKASALIESWLIQLVLFLSLPLDKNQIRELAWLIFDDNRTLNLAEITLLFSRIKKGYYGQFFNRIDPAELLRWCREYRKERGMYISKLPDNYVSPELEKAKEEWYDKQNSKMEEQK